MALPVIPFVVGAAAGAAATYLYKDKEFREDFVHTSLHYLFYLNPWRKKEEEVSEEETTQKAGSEDSVIETTVEATPEDKSKSKSEASTDSGFTEKPAY